MVELHSPGGWLKKWRQEACVSQADAAKAVGVAQATWSDWENDLKRPSLANALEIERVTDGSCVIGLFQCREKAEEAYFLRTWRDMIARCYNPNGGDANYKNWGGSGVYVCARWRTFENFFQDIGPKPGRIADRTLRRPNYSLDRIDPHGSYTCGRCFECKQKKAKPNCRWATAKQQARNRRPRTRAA